VPKTLAKIVDIKEKNDARDPALIPLYCQLAWCFKKRDLFKDAERVLRRAHSIAKHVAPESAQSALLEVTMAHNYNMQRQYAKAESHLKKAIKTLSRPAVPVGVVAGQSSAAPGEDPAESSMELRISSAASEAEADVCGAIFELSMVYINQSKFKEAQEQLEHLLSIHERSPLANPELFADTLFQLGLCCEKLIQYRKAKFYLERSVTIRERLYGFENEEVAGALFKLSKCLQKLDEYVDARMVQQQAEQIMKQLRSRS
jgi:tetratricopeptide (TPR) repeat protein